jgi:hypothetical protein
MNKALNILLVTLMSVTLLSSFIIPPEVEAGKRGGGDGKRGGGDGKRNVKVDNSKRDVRTNKVRSTSVNNVNVNRSTNIDIDVDRDRHHHHHGWDDDYHPIATAAAVTAAVVVTSAVVGSIVRTVPPGCVPVNYGGIVYQQCGTTWYQPQYVGSSVQYVVIVQPY